MTKLTGKVLIAQGGGPTAVINQSLVGAVLESRKFPEVTRVYGAINGVRGIVEENLLDLTQETTHNLEQVAMTPSSALLSTRDKPDEAYCREIFKVCQAHDVRYFFYIGGNDSADTVRIVNQNADRAGYDMRCIHIPKTIDNDLVVNDHTPGYGSAARFVAQAFMGFNLDNRALPGVFIGVVMGRHAGFLTAASALGKKYPDDGPHCIYVPERPFSEDQFLKDVKKAVDSFGRCVVAVSEGIVDKDGQPVAVKLTGSKEADAHGNIQLSGTGALGDMLSQVVKSKLKIMRLGRSERRRPSLPSGRISMDRSRSSVRETTRWITGSSLWRRSPPRPRPWPTSSSTRMETAPPPNFTPTPGPWSAPVSPTATESGPRRWGRS